MILAGLAGALLGGGVGYFVSRHVSKLTGGVCPILCNPKVSIPYFVFIGLIVSLEFFA